MFYFSMDILYGVILKRFLCLFIGTAFIFTSIIPASYAQAVFNLPEPGQMVALSEVFAPVVLKGMSIHPEDPLLFDFIVDNGHTGLKGQALTNETTKLVKYFLAGLAVPETDLWVNLSPKEKDRIMADDLSHTDVGRDMLAQDYMLKQITSTLMYPEEDLGRRFWDQVYAETYQKLGHVDVPVDSFNKVWITPDEATVYQNGNKAFVAGAHLKVMLESDYEAAKMGDAAAVDATQELAKQVVRDIILPVLEKEVNEGKNFAPLRQVFQSMILAGWYKNALKASLLNQVYSNSNKVDGIDIAEKNAKQKVYAQYMEAYQKGVYNYIKEELDQNTDEIVARKYFSGGQNLIAAVNPKDDGVAEDVKSTGETTTVSYSMHPIKKKDKSEDNKEQVKKIFTDEYLKGLQSWGYGSESGRVTPEGPLNSYVFMGPDGQKWLLSQLNSTKTVYTLRNETTGVVLFEKTYASNRTFSVRTPEDMKGMLGVVIDDYLEAAPAVKQIKIDTFKREKRSNGRMGSVYDFEITLARPVSMDPQQHRFIVKGLQGGDLDITSMIREMSVNKALKNVPAWKLVFNTSVDITFAPDQEYVLEVRADQSEQMDVRNIFTDEYLKDIQFLGHGPESGRVNAEGPVNSYRFAGSDNINWVLIQVNGFDNDIVKTTYELKNEATGKTVLTMKYPVSKTLVVRTAEDAQGMLGVVIDDYLGASATSRQIKVASFQRYEKSEDPQKLYYFELTLKRPISLDPGQHRFTVKGLKNGDLDITSIVRDRMVNKSFKDAAVWKITFSTPVDTTFASDEQLVLEIVADQSEKMSGSGVSYYETLKSRVRAIKNVAVGVSLGGLSALTITLVLSYLARLQGSDIDAMVINKILYAGGGTALAGIILHFNAAWLARSSVAQKQTQGGIDLGQGNYLKVIATDAAGMPQFDPAEIQELQKDLRGIMPVPVGVPQPVNMRSLLGVNV